MSDSQRRVLGPWPQRMVNPIRDYDWGSRTALAWMQGRVPTGRPEAELWMGAHPSAPSSLLGLDGTAQALDILIEEQPQVLLGAEVLSRFGTQLPFLFKILAFDQPLSLQVHPTGDRAREAWRRQQAAEGQGGGAEQGAGAEHEPGAEPGTKTESAGRSGTRTGTGGHQYADPYPKPELLYALQPVDAMCGFRSTGSAIDLIERLDCSRLAPLLDRLRGPGSDAQRLQEAFAQLLHWPQDERTELAGQIGQRARALLAAAGPPDPAGLGPADRRAIIWTSRLSRLHPKDPLVAAPLLLDVIRLEPGETLFVPAGAPHAYLYGLGLEIMANSDNVLRAGLTHKAIAVDELLEVIDGRTRPVQDIPERLLGPREVAWRPPVEQFQLTRLRLPDHAPTAVYPFIGGPQLLLCTAGSVGVATTDHAVMLRPGESAFVAAGGGPITVAGPGEVFRAAVGEPQYSI